LIYNSKPFFYLFCTSQLRMKTTILIISIVSSLNLTFLAIYFWIFRHRERPFFWLGCMNLSVALVITDNLILYFQGSNPYLYHFSSLINLSWGAYFINLARALKNKPLYKHQILLFLPSVLYFLFAVYTFFIPGFNSNLFEHILNNKIHLANLIPNFIILFYSIGANAVMLFLEYRENRKREKSHAAKIRIELLFTFFIFQLVAFSGYILTQAVVFLYLFMPFAALLAYIWMFFRVQHIISIKKLQSENVPQAEIKPMEKYKTLKITESQKSEIADLIMTHLKRDKPFLDSGYKLSDLSKNISVSTHLCSMVINSYFAMSFHDLINKHRIEEALAIIRTEKNPKIEALAYTCGFGNKASFYSAFKKHTGKLPKEIVNDIENIFE
jgi:AraC-like DNA-binding protein